MSTGISLDNLALMLGVDSSAMTTGFMSASASSRAMTRALMDGLNRELEKGNQEAAENFARMPQLASAQFAAHIGEYKKYGKEVQMVEQKIMSELVAEQRIWHELFAERENVRNRELASRREELANMQKIADEETEILRRSAALRNDIIQRSLESEKEANEERISDLRTAIENRYILMRSQENADKAIMDGLLEEQRIWHELYTERANILNRPQSLATAERANIQATAEQDQEIEDRSRALREAILARKATEDLEKAKTRLSAAKRLQMKLDEDSARIMAVENQRKRENAALNKQAAQILAMLQTPQEAHNARLAIFKNLLGRGKINQDQFNAAVKQSEGVMRSSAAGAGKMTGVLAQLSFGIEDFAQGIVMGDLRAALLGASNNMTMVVRGLIDMAGETKIAGMAVGKFVGIVAGAVVVGGGLAYYLNWLSQAIRDTRSLTDAIRDATMGFGRMMDSVSTRAQIRQQSYDIKRIKTLDEITAKEEQNALKQLENEDRIFQVRQDAQRKAKETIDSMMGGAEARVDIENMLAKMESSGNEEAARVAIELQKNIANAQRLVSEGNAETAIAEMRKVFEFLNSESSQVFAKLFMFGGAGIEDFRSMFFDRTALNALEEYFQKSAFFAGESADKLREIRTIGEAINKDLATEQDKEKIRLAELADLELRRREIEAERFIEQQKQFQLNQHNQELQRKELLFLVTATEHEKELLRLKKETQAFAGPGAAGLPVPVGGIGGAMMGGAMQMAIDAANAEAEQRRLEFLQAQRQQLQLELNTLMQKEVKPAGQLEQNAFQAQADAFKQIVENMSNRPNPQTTRIINLITSIDAALRNGGVIKVVP